MLEGKKQLEMIHQLNQIQIIVNGLNILSLSQIFLFEMYLERLKFNSILNTLKILSLDSYVKAFQSLFIPQKDLFKNKFLFVNDIYNKSMINNMRTVEGVVDSPFNEVIVDKRISIDQSYFLWHFFNFKAYITFLPKFLKTLFASWSQIRETSHLFKVPHLIIILNLFESYFILNCLKNFFEKNDKIEKIILNSDVHKVSRGIALYSKSKQIQSYVLQHGTTVLEYGYLPLKANFIFTWGSLSNEWFLKRNTDEKRIITTGTPKMDMINFPANVNINKKIKKILVIVNPIGKNNVLKYLDLIYESNIHDEYDLIIKLHPGSVDNRSEVLNVFKDTNVLIEKNVNVHHLIRETDLVITTTSTVGNEAIAFYKPLIQICHTSTPSNNLMDYDRLNCSINVSSSKDLKEILFNKYILNSKIKNYEDFINQYFYKLDGLASKRIVDIMKGNS